VCVDVGISQIIGVVKAYTTRVGGGIFKTEDLGEAGAKLQEIGELCGYFLKGCC